MRKNRLISQFAVLTLAVSLMYLSGQIGSLAFAQTGAPAPFKVLHNFAGEPTDGAVPFGSLILSGNNLYGMTNTGGVHDEGTIFRFNTQTRRLAILYNFDGTHGDGPYGDLILSGNKLYGMTYQGGVHGYGTIFDFNTQTRKLTVLYNFDGTHGANPTGNLVLSGKTLYGVTYRGGASGYGTIFKVDIKTAYLTTLHDFTGEQTDGANPYSSLILSGKNLYGTTYNGGLNDDGTIFEFNTQTPKLTILHSFSAAPTDGANPCRSLILSGETLYGMTTYGGANGYGTVFEFNTQTPNLTILHSFAGEPADGTSPWGSLILSGKTLYGMSGGGAGEVGTLFEVNTKTGQLTILHNFVGEPTDGADPHGSLILSGEKLYGMSSAGGSSNDGVIFSYTLK